MASTAMAEHETIPYSFLVQCDLYDWAWLTLGPCSFDLDMILENISSDSPILLIQAHVCVSISEFQATLQQSHIVRSSPIGSRVVAILASISRELVFD
jgi:hypothetical protein